MCIIKIIRIFARASPSAFFQEGEGFIIVGISASGIWETYFTYFRGRGTGRKGFYYNFYVIYKVSCDTDYLQSQFSFFYQVAVYQHDLGPSS